jgi:endonuclease/exonuclease/phosphatase family metal-dependent hydrolase
MEKTAAKPLWKKVMIAILILIGLVVAIVGAYVLYIVLGYERIEDQLELTVSRTADESAAGDVLKTETEYSILTFNIGFGAYDHEYSFFMDKGYLADGTETVGIYSRARSEQAAVANTNTVTVRAIAEYADIYLFQEVDKKADRSFGVDQVQYFLDHSGLDLWYDYATNFHSGYLFYPPTKPIGKIADSGLLTASKFEITSASRVSLPVSDAFPTKFFDLDRCIVVSHLPVKTEGGASAELSLINIHPSAYDEGGLIRAEQMKVLAGIMEEEYAKGNYVIVGGDFNHAFGGTEEAFAKNMKRPDWVQSFDEAMLPEGFHVVIAGNVLEIGTCRDTSIPYNRGFNYEVVVDGFVVSDNVSASSVNIDADYTGSDHNPVKLKFTLIE